mmetsp:Transcript_14120/g.40125  ORF Transcript_14120/g.40125 Transcript_14120/m.40125 type:complete len:303 (-) Transcript_14120:86-994(-)
MEEFGAGTNKAVVLGKGQDVVEANVPRGEVEQRAEFHGSLDLGLPVPLLVGVREHHVRTEEGPNAGQVPHAVKVVEGIEVLLELGATLLGQFGLACLAPFLLSRKRQLVPVPVAEDADEILVEGQELVEALVHGPRLTVLRGHRDHVDVEVAVLLALDGVFVITQQVGLGDSERVALGALRYGLRRGAREVLPNHLPRRLDPLGHQLHRLPHAPFGAELQLVVVAAQDGPRERELTRGLVQTCRILLLHRAVPLHSVQDGVLLSLVCSAAPGASDYQAVVKHKANDRFLLLSHFLAVQRRVA